MLNSVAVHVVGKNFAMCFEREEKAVFMVKICLSRHSSKGATAEMILPSRVNG